jgi:hypothetical protein
MATAKRNGKLPGVATVTLQGAVSGEQWQRLRALAGPLQSGHNPLSSTALSYMIMWCHWIAPIKLPPGPSRVSATTPGSIITRPTLCASLVHPWETALGTARRST